MKQNKAHLHLVFEGEGVSVQAAVSLQFAQDDAFFKEEDLSLVPSRGHLHFRILLPHCKDSLKGKLSIYEPNLITHCLK